MKKIYSVYLAGPMRGIPEYNFPAFHAAAKKLRAAGHTVFNPAERDIEKYGKEVSHSPTGDERDSVKAVGFNLREALCADLTFICNKADAIALLSGWENSRGVAAELATAKALGLTEIYLEK